MNVNVNNGFNLWNSVDYFNDKHSVKISKEERKDLKLTGENDLHFKKLHH